MAIDRKVVSVSVGFIVLIGVGSVTAPTKLVIIAILAALAMGLGSVLAHEIQRSKTKPEHIVWGQGLSSGLMVASTGLFILPTALQFAPKWGGLGVSSGVLVGYIIHSLSHETTHRLSSPPVISELTVHALSTGLVIGVIYTIMPSLSVLLGIAIFSHKFPAGYVGTIELHTNDTPIGLIVYPSTAVGFAALPVGIIGISAMSPQLMSCIFGVGAGIFFHIALDNLPKCEVGSDVHEIIECCTHTKATHEMHDSLRRHAIASTLIGILLVIGSWVIIG